MSGQRRSPRVMENNAITENEILKERLAECEKDQLDTLIIMIKQKQQEMVDDGKLMSDMNVPGLEDNLSKFSSAGREYFHAKMGLHLPMTDEEIEDHFHKMDMSKGGKRRKSSRKHRKKKSGKSRSRRIRKGRKNKTHKKRKSKKSRKHRKRGGVAPNQNRPRTNIPVTSPNTSIPRPVLRRTITNSDISTLSPNARDTPIPRPVLQREGPRLYPQPPIFPRPTSRMTSEEFYDGIANAPDSGNP